MFYHSVKIEEAKSLGFINISQLLFQYYRWNFDSVEMCKKYDIVTLQNHIVLLSKHNLDFRKGKIKTDIGRVLFKNTKIYFDPEYLIKTDEPIFKFSNTVNEDDIDTIKKIEWTHEAMTFCWPKEDLYEAVGEILLIEEYNRSDRSIECVSTTGKFKGKKYTFPVFCLMLPEAVYLKKERKFFSSNLLERIKCYIDYLVWRVERVSNL